MIDNPIDSIIEFRQLAPLLLVFGAAVLGVLVEALIPDSRRQWRGPIQITVTVTALLAALGYTMCLTRNGVQGVFAMGSIVLDGPTKVMWALLLVFGLLALMVFNERKVNGGVSSFASSAATAPGSFAESEADSHRLEHTEVFPLGLFAIVGMMVFVASNDLLTLFVALEVFSLPLYLLSGMARRRRLLSQEAALKYFLLGAFSSAIFLFGAALLYGFSGSLEYVVIAQAVGTATAGRSLLYAGMILLAVGFLFKIGAVPFASWVPDVYMGAPTPVTGFMAIATKLAAMGALLRVFYVALGGEITAWQPVLAVVALLTMVVGTVMALTQTDVKRLLAYSSIAHAGFLLTAVVGAANDPAQGPTSVASILFYLAAYGLATVGAFAIVTLVRNPAGEENSMPGWAGLGRKNPWAAGAMSFFLLSFAGIPLTGGFVGKWTIFAAAWRGGFWWLVVVAVLVSLVAAFFYLRFIVVMFAHDNADGIQVGEASGWTWLPIVVGVVGTLVLGVAPDAVLTAVSSMGQFLPLTLR